MRFLEWVSCNCNSDIEKNSLYGDLLCLLSGACIAVTFVCASKSLQLTDSITYSKVAFIVAALTIGLVCFLLVQTLWFLMRSMLFGFCTSHISIDSWPQFLTYSLKHLPPTAVASIPLGEPIIASVLAFLIFSESIPTASIVGGPLILFGIYKILKNSLID